MGSRAYVAIFLIVALLSHVKGSSEPWLKSEKYAEQGTEVQLPCILKLPQCVGLHSIKWYRGNSRIFIYSEDVGVTRGNNDIAARSHMIISENTTKTYLKIPNLKVEDEGLYRCEATYLAVNRECNNVQHIILNVTVQPTSIRVIDEDTKQTLENGRTLGPMNEGSTITLRCESAEGRPVPSVEWFNGDKRLEAESSSKAEENGVGVGSSVLHLKLSRSELGATLTCKVNSIALLQPLTIDIKLDVHVRPLKMGIKGVVGHVIQGTKVLLQCSVSAARPPANVTWYNGTELLDGGSERLEMFDTKVQNNTDSTAETKSFLAFTASEYDNGRTYGCHAENSVMQKEGIKPMTETTTIEVLYPPIVTMRPENITVNETQDFFLFCDYDSNPMTLLKVKWLLNEDELQLNNDHYDGGNTEQPALIVKNATPSDMGVYSCVLENSVGESNTQDFIEVSVLYKPVVEVSMEPDAPVNEADRLNISLTCEVTAGNPTILTAVRWYLDGGLLKELPDCSRNTTPASIDEPATFCDIDPSKLLLEAVGRSFHGNYSCEGRNDAGWGPVSLATPVVVNYKPGPAAISYSPKLVVKKNSLNISCSVTDMGRPEVSGFKWMRGSHRLPDENKSVLSIESVNLETEANFTCMAYNEAGDGDPATTFIDVSAPPAFIKKLPPYYGYVYNSPNVSIECWVECAPICNISWTKDGVPMDFSSASSRYTLINTYHLPDLRTNDFESIQSTLVWNLTFWSNGQLDRLEDNGKFSCESTGNGIGPGVKSSTHFHVEFPPENMTISKKTINVIVDHIPETVTCSAKAHPEPTFRWFREGSIETISEGRILVFKTTVPRRSNGTYYCEASNRHGSRNISTYMNVQFKPECRIDRERVDGRDYVVCSAVANPQESDFVWSLKSDNDTLEHAPETRDGKSYLLLDDSVTNFRTYVCIANNSIGSSSPCERDVPGNIPWWLRLEGDLLIIVIAVAVIIVLVIIVICVVVFLFCRHKRSQVKYPNQTANNSLRSVSENLPDPETKSFYENLPFHGMQAPPNKTNNVYDYKEHYQQHPQQQEMQQYGYPIPSNSSSQLTLPLTRNLYHSSVVSPLQTSFVQAANNHQLRANMIAHADSEGPTLLSLVQDGAEDTSTYERSGRNRPGGTRRTERRKHRKHDRKHQKQRRRQPSEPLHCDLVDQELGIPESFKISYPHYYEDAISECPQEYHQMAQHRQGRYIDGLDPEQYSDHSLSNSRSKSKTNSNRDGKAPSIAQYAELHFRDVGQEIDV